MSLRPITYQHSSPSTPPASSFQSAQYPFPQPSPTRSPLSVQAKHQAQLASYRRDPSKAGPSHSPILYPSSPRRSRRRPDVEDGSSDEENGKAKEGSWKRGWRVYLSLGFFSRRKSSQRFVLYAITIVAVYVIFLRPLSTTSHPAEVGSSSAAVQSTPEKRSSAPTTPSSHIKRAPLPPQVVSAKTSDHTISRGLLNVNPDSKVHPVYQLIKDAREHWDAKVAKQSKTLKEAVEEYRRRYHRNPPKGFDKWWDYVVYVSLFLTGCNEADTDSTNDVQMPDEYDQIMKDLLPFYALSPKDLKNRLEETAQMPDTYVVRVRHGSIRSTARFDADVIAGADDRQGGQIDLLRPVARYLPDLMAVYSVHDTPSQLLSWDHRRELMDHIEEDECESSLPSKGVGLMGRYRPTRRGRHYPTRMAPRLSSFFTLTTSCKAIRQLHLCPSRPFQLSHRKDLHFRSRSPNGHL